MFKPFENFSAIAPDVDDIKKVYRVSGISSLEEVLSDTRNNPDCCLCVLDSGTGFLSLLSNRLDNAFHTIYIMVKSGKLSEHDARVTAKRKAMEVGIKLFDRAKQETEYGALFAGLDAAKINYDEIGPIGVNNNYVRYSFGFMVNQDL